MRDENEFGEAWLEEKAGIAREELARLGAVGETTHATTDERLGSGRLKQETCLLSEGAYEVEKLRVGRYRTSTTATFHNRSSTATMKTFRRVG